MTSFLLLSVFIYISYASLKGVSPEVLSIYQQEQFTCGDGKVLSKSAINDDYCDCRDGSDEPGTSACSNGRFWCQNKGAIGNYIPSSRVDDLICDCCDGSDELSGCRDTCREIAEASNKETLRKIANQKMGMQYAQLKANEHRERISNERLHLVELSQKKTEAQFACDLNEKQIQESESALETLKQKIESEKQSEIEKKLADWVEEKRREVEDPEEEKERQKEKEQQEQEQQNNENNENNANENNENNANAEIEPEEEAVTQQMKDSQLTIIKEEFWKQDPSYSGLKTFLDGFKEKSHDLKRTNDDIQSEIDRANEYLNKDTGPQERFAYMIDQKYEISKDQYTYTVNPYGHSTQSHTSVGNWKGFSEDYTKMLFDRGQGCWGGPDRSLEVNMICGESTRIIDVREESKCTYIMNMETPGACNENDLKKLEAALL